MAGRVKFVRFTPLFTLPWNDGAIGLDARIKLLSEDFCNRYRYKSRCLKRYSSYRLPSVAM